MDERYAVVDVETTGLSIYRDRVVEIGCVLVDGGAIADQWSTLVDPGIPIPGRASAIHGITDADVDGAPDFDDALAMLRRKVGRRTIAAHNATFDLAFLAPLRPERAICTMRLARVVAPEAPNHKNQTLREFFGIDDVLPKYTQAHSALGDALVTAHVLIACRKRCGPARWAHVLQAALVHSAARNIA
ncbi:MAG: 3'-5' exonuclease [Burkholderiales bacterium]